MDNQTPEPSAGPATYGGRSSNAPAKAFTVNMTSLQALHKQWQLLIKDVTDFNRQLGGIGKQTGLQNLLKSAGGGGSGGGGSNLSTGSVPQPRNPNNQSSSSSLSRGQTAARFGLASAVGVVAAPGAYLSSNFSPIAQMNYLGNNLAQGAGTPGGYSPAVAKSAQRSLAGLTGYRNTADLVQGVQTLAPYAGSYGTSRFSSVMKNAGQFSNLNPSAGAAGGFAAAASLYAPQTNLALMSIGAGGSLGAGGTLTDPQTIAKNLLTRIYKGKPWTAEMITEGMQPGAPLYRSLQFLPADTQQYIAEYGIAWANLGGDPNKVKQALANPKSKLARQAGVGSSSMIGQMNSLGQKQTSLQTNMGIDAQGSFNDSVTVFSKAVSVLAGGAGLGGVTSGIIGGTSVLGMTGSGAINRTLNLGGGFLGYNLLAKGAGSLATTAKNRAAKVGGLRKIFGIGAEDASQDLASGGGLKGLVTGAVSDTVGLEAARAAGATPVYVMNWPSGGIGGGGGSGFGKIGKLGKGGVATEGEEAAAGAGEGEAAGVAGASGMSGIAAIGALGLGAAGAVGGQLITHIGRHNGKANRGARVGGDTLSGAATGAGIGFMVGGPMGAAVGGAVGGAAGFIKGGGVGDVIHGLGLNHKSTSAETQQYQALLAQVNSGGYHYINQFQSVFNNTILPMATVATRINNRSSWRKVNSALQKLMNQYKGQASSNLKAAGNYNYSVAYAGSAMSGRDPYGNGEMGASNDLTSGSSGVTWPAIEALANHGPAHRVTATTNGHHAKNSYHYKGEAVDFAGLKPSVDSRELLAINQFFAKNYGTELAELIYAGPGGTNIKNGKVVSAMAVYGADTMSEHHNHVHVAATPQTLGGAGGGVSVAGGGSGSGTGPGGTSALTSLLGGVVGGVNPSHEEVDSLMAILGGFGPSAAAASSGAAAAGSAANTGASGSGTMGNKTPGWGASPPAAPSNISGSVALGKQMATSLGWGNGGEWNALYQLWERESGWNANAVNKHSGAYGIPQALGHGHPYNLGDARSQIAWGLSYVQGRYGDPLKAWAHEKGVGWYDKGAWNLDRDQAAVVHKGEMIVPAKEAAEMRASVSMPRSSPSSNGGRAVTINLTAPVTLAGTATNADAQAHVNTIMSILQKNTTIAAIGAGV